MIRLVELQDTSKSIICLDHIEVIKPKEVNLNSRTFYEIRISFNSGNTDTYTYNDYMRALFDEDMKYLRSFVDVRYK